MRMRVRVIHRASRSQSTIDLQRELSGIGITQIVAGTHINLAKSMLAAVR
jgi:hypothetical protein